MKKTLLMMGLFFCVQIHAAPSFEIITKRMLSDLDFIKSSFEVKYAPILWKKEFADWDLNVAHQAAKERVLRLSHPSVKECQIILKDFFLAAKDYHVNISFFSTEAANLPFIGMSAEGHYYVMYVDTSEIADLEVGDEILTFDGLPVMEVIEQLRDQELGRNTQETDLALAELLLTSRNGAQGHRIPKGDVVLTVRRKGTKDIDTVHLTWLYQEERIKSTKTESLSLSCKVITPQTSKEDLYKAFFQKMMIAPAFFKKPSHFAENNYWIGSKKSYLPSLGKVVWENESDDQLDAYVFRITDSKLLPEGKKYLQVGYIRIPHYGGSELEAEEFQELISFMDYKTDVLIIDQINNPGGSVFYMYALASMLTDVPMNAPKHRISLTQQEVTIAALILEELDSVEKNDDDKAKEVFGDTLGGYEVNYHFVDACRTYCQHLITEWNQGHLFTSPIHLWGIDQIQPHSKNRYTKPILMLINSLDFSGGDFFPAILQDNKRVKLLGTRTAGAGGFLVATSYPNLLGVQQFQFTGSFAIRENGDPLENLGVHPDVPYTLTKMDLENNYGPYVKKILETVITMSKL